MLPPQILPVTLIILPQTLPAIYSTKNRGEDKGGYLVKNSHIDHIFIKIKNKGLSLKTH